MQQYEAVVRPERASCLWRYPMHRRYMSRRAKSPTRGERGLAFFLFEKGRKQKKTPQTPYAPFICIGLAALRACRVACVRDLASSIDFPCICPRCRKQPPGPGRILKDQTPVAATKDENL